MVKDQVEILGFCQLVEKVTRAWPGQPASIVDHVWTNSPTNIISVSNCVRGSSDHNVLSVILRTRDRREHVHDIWRRDRRKFNLNDFREKIKNIDWGNFYQCRDINLLNDKFVEKVGGILVKTAPRKSYQFRIFLKNWITPELKDQMRSRDQKREQARITGDKKIWNEYRLERNKCTKNLKNVKNEYLNNIFEKLDSENDTKNIFNVTRKLLNWKNGGPPQNFLIQGKLIRRPDELATHQMNYFTEQVKNLISRLPASTTNPLKWLAEAELKWKGRGTFESFSFKEISLNETISLISKLGNSTSSGIDHIDALAIKAATTLLAPPLRHIINVSLSTSRFANRWKISQLLPLLKSSDANKLLPSSYRPVAILPVVSKLVEKTVQSQLLQFLQKNRMLNTSSHAYKPGHSTTTAMIELTEELYSAVEDKKISAIMTLDQSSAFDCVHHQILISKLEYYNISEKVTDWIRDYLSHRSQFVSIGTSDSPIHPMSRGVPQGSVLGPLLFSIFTNELSEVVRDPECTQSSHQNTEKMFGEECDKCGKIIQYADDTTYHIASWNRIRNQLKLKLNLNRLGEFLTSNQLSINKSKTHLEEIMLKQKRGRLHGHPPELEVTNDRGEPETVKVKGNIRILGMNVEKDLTWNAHLETGMKPLLPGIRKNLGALRSLGKTLPPKSRNILARDFVISRISYLICVWGGSTPNLIRKAQRVVNAAARWVDGMTRRTRITRLQEMTGWNSVEEMTRLSAATIIWKTINMGTPGNLAESLKWNEETLEMEICPARINFTRKKFTHREAVWWNEIPTEIRKIKTIGSFKRKIKGWIKGRRNRMPD